MDSNSDAASVANKFTDLELKYSFQENMLTDLNDALVSQQQQLDALKHELAVLKQHLAETPEPESTSGQHSPADEKPPHY